MRSQHHLNDVNSHRCGYAEGTTGGTANVHSRGPTHLLGIVCNVVGPQTLGQDLLVVVLLSLDSPGLLVLAHELGSRTRPKACKSTTNAVKLSDLAVNLMTCDGILVSTLHLRTGFGVCAAPPAQAEQSRYCQSQVCWSTLPTRCHRDPASLPGLGATHPSIDSKRELEVQLPGL